MTDRARGSDRTPSSFEGMFAPGTVLIGRYRIIALIGEGGMGEVYLADDLTLEHPVAIKFLPEHVAEREGGLERFRQEVRIARQVTHPNVARVHDIGEVDGRHFLTMEFVDGEDLARLLKRIGRFPREKAIDIAQQLCAGVAAAHELRVLHRDLKPANVMLDGEGRVKVTDFGLAAVAGGSEEPGVVVGTPAYMAPEQLEGREVTQRSEVYSLGLVLYELFTGRRAFEGGGADGKEQRHDPVAPQTPSSVVTDIDPSVERVLMRCLERDPANRPPSVRAVALALPGGDPLAAAVAAGETPAPDLVAEAGERGGLSVRVALSLLGLFAALLAGYVVLSGHTQLARRVALDLPPQVLVQRARDVLKRVGYDEPPRDSAYAFFGDDGYLRWIAENDDSPHRWDRVEATRPPTMRFLYRQSPGWLEKRDAGQNVAGRIEPSDPPHDRPGMVRMWLDPSGDLLSLSVVPPSREPAGDTAPGAPRSRVDWEVLFAASGLDPAAFEPARPEWTPDVPGDERLAWVGPYAGTDLTVRIEVASAAGRPVSWRVWMPWELSADDTSENQGPSAAGVVVQGLLIVGLLGGAAALAVRNLRAKRGDRSGAVRFALFLFVAQMLHWLLGEHHVASEKEIALLFDALSVATLDAMLAWIAYLAIEPEVRRLWPQRIVSWVRLLDGRFRDPLVGRDLLLGCLLGLVLALVKQGTPLVSEWLGVPPPAPTFLSSIQEYALRGGRYHLALLPGALSGMLPAQLMLIVALVLLRYLLRRQWAAVAAQITLAVVFGDHEVVTMIGSALGMGILLFAVLRCGLLSLMATALVYGLVQGFPLLFGSSSWLVPNTLFVLAVVVGLALWGFWVALAGRPIFAEIGPGATRSRD